MKARLALLATMCVVIVLNACGNVNSLQATLPTITDTLSVWALSGTPPDFPSGLSIIQSQAVRIDGFAGFDVALDIDSNGNPVIYPVKLVVSTPGTARVVGLQIVPGTFETVLEAPKTGFEPDSGLVIAPGKVVTVESQHNGSGDLCQLTISPNVYAKITVDSVNLASRMLFLRMTLDTNCGFRSFADGIPTS
jgi:hypothetical protein